MTDASRDRRTDRADRLIKASPRTIYAALVDAAAVAVWLPPDGMKGQVLAFEPHAGGAFRMALIYEAPDDTTQGKTSDQTDVVSGHFVALEPDRRVVQETAFQSDDPAFAGVMRITWALEPVPASASPAKTSLRGFPRRITTPACARRSPILQASRSRLLERSR